ncbi:MAG: adenylate/guanylate cyclase domain-containing protein [Chloroflexota bacterium]|nr:MAG: adenylate/guanylate cyclase domain-containing protein [Chloroflexota bacterium]
MLPSGTVTFLFTDIEGSTKLWQQFPDAMPAALARHHEILNSTIQAHNGYVFQIIGDAFCAAFATAFDGLDAALDAQRALRDEGWGETSAIRVRMALHTGTAEVRAGEFTSGEYVSGITLSRAARLLSAGHGGQILLSSPAAELVREQLPQNTALLDMGAQRLKDLVQPQQIFQILAPDLPQDFPALKTLDALPNNLPIHLTSFVGREKEIAQIVDLLTADSRPQTAENESSVRRSSSVVRLLTLTGAGGSGKTRLSLQVAAEVIEEFEKGAWFVELAPIADASLVPNAVMSAFELREEAARAPLDALTDFLRAKKLLLILDNCEHLIEACAQLAHHLLTHCPHLKILATSREALGVAGEVTYSVPPLGIPDDRRQTADDEYTARVTQYDAVKLFIERAVTVQPNFSVTNANAPAVAQICFRLDGIPLAIELAAARIKLFSPEQIAARLDDRLRLLTGGSRTAMPRQQTLRAAIEWSYGLLSERERVLFRRLTVFVGGWTFEAAEAVCAGEGLDVLDILELMSHLVDKSLVTTEAREEETRYRMLETIREYALEKLNEAGEDEIVRDRHLQFFLKIANNSEHHLRGSDPIEWLEQVEAEYDNLRAVMDWCQKSPLRVASALQFVSALGDFWLDRGFLTEGRERIVDTLASANSLEHTAFYAKALCNMGWLASFQGDFSAAESFTKESLTIFRSLGDKQGISESLHVMGTIAIDSKNYAAATTLLEEALEIRRVLNDARGIRESMRALGWATFGLGNYTLARTHLEQALMLDSKEGDRGGVAGDLNGLAEVALRENKLGSASEMIKESLAIRREIGDKWGIGVAFGVWGWIALLEHDWDGAYLRLRESIAVRNEIGDVGGLVWCLEKLAQVKFEKEHYETATQVFGAAATKRGVLGSTIDPFDVSEYEQIIQTLHTNLAETKFSAAWNKGRALTMEQAIELAMQDE